MDIKEKEVISIVLMHKFHVSSSPRIRGVDEINTGRLGFPLWMICTWMGGKGRHHEANTKATKRGVRPGNATLASSRYVCWWRFHISSEHHLSRTPPYRVLPPSPSPTVTPSSTSTGELASSAYRHPANTHRIRYVGERECRLVHIDSRLWFSGNLRAILNA